MTEITSDSVFGDLDLDSVGDNPFAPDPGTYGGYIKSSRVQKTKDGSRKWVLTYQVQDDSDQVGQTAQEWLTIPEREDYETVDGKRQRKFIKYRWRTLGYSEEAMKTANPQDVTGLPVNFTVRQSGENNEYTNVVSVSLAAGGREGFDSPEF